MHDYNTILGVIELRLSKVSYDAVQKRYCIGRSGIALIMNRYNDSGLSLDDLRQMPPTKVVDLIYPKEKLRHYKYFLKVPDNYHLEYDAHYYSVLYTYKGKSAILKATMTEIRICDEYNRLICRHPRSYRDFPLYITDDNHMPPEHLYYKEVNAHDGAYYRRWASVYGESMVTLIDRILRSSKHEEQAYNSCAGVLHSCKDVPHRLVQEAAEKCVEANACKYSYFKKVLSMVQNNHSSSAINGTGKLPSHTNIRGKEAYK